MRKKIPMWGIWLKGGEGASEEAAGFEDAPRHEGGDRCESRGGGVDGAGA